MATNLIKGQKVDITKINPNINKLLVDVSWNGSNEVELDASAFMLGENGKVIREEDFVFYGNDLSTCKSISLLQSTVQTEKQQFDLFLQKVPNDVKTISFCLTIYQPEERKHYFRDVSKIAIGVYEGLNQRPLFQFPLDFSLDKESAIVLGSLYRYNGYWKFHAVGSGFFGGLAALCGDFGIEVENEQPIVEEHDDIVEASEMANNLDKYDHLKTPKEILSAIGKLKQPKKSGENNYFSYEVYSSYSRFMEDSIKYANAKGTPCKEIPFQSYWSSFAELNSDQLKWYLFWREEVIKENYMEVDLSYIFLFSYELLNYTFNQSASFNIKMLIRLYENYVEMHAKLESYLPRWIADMLYELEEAELAKEWDLQTTKVPKLYGQIKYNKHALHQISIPAWKPYIRNYRETIFFQAHKNKIYKIFKENIHLIEDYVESSGRKLEEYWFEKKQTRDVRNLFVGAVLGREINPIHVYYQQYKETETLYKEVTNLFRLSENVARRLNGETKEIKVEMDALPPDIKNRMINKYQKSPQPTNRFQVVQKKQTTNPGSAIPLQPEEKEAETAPEFQLNLDTNRIKELSNQSTRLQNLFEERASAYKEEDRSQFLSSNSLRQLNGGNVNSQRHISMETNYRSSLDPHFINRLSVMEKEFLQLFKNGKLLQDEAKLFTKQRGMMLGMFLSSLNEKANEFLEDNLIEVQGEELVVYEEFEQIVVKIKENSADEY